MPWRRPRPHELARTVAGAACAGFATFALSAFAPPADARSAYAGRVGVSSHLVWASRSNAGANLERLRNGGVGWIREDFAWRSIETTRGKFNWGHTDVLMAVAARRRVRVLAVLSYSPPWASSDPSGRGSGVYPPRNVRDFARFAAAVVQRYGPAGVFWRGRPRLRERPLKAVEFWNEPAGFWNWRPEPDPAAYARLSFAAAKAVKETDRTVDVLVAGEVIQTRSDRSVVDWLANVIAANRQLVRLTDAYAIHPYPHPFTKGPYDDLSPRYFWDYRRVAVARNVAVALHATRPFWITEVGWSTATSAPGGVTEEVQAEHVRGAVQRAIGDWGSFVERIFIYSWGRSNGDLYDREGNFGLLRPDGSEKPAWNALTNLIRSERRSAADTLSVAIRRTGGP